MSKTLDAEPSLHTIALRRAEICAGRTAPHMYDKVKSEKEGDDVERRNGIMTNEIIHCPSLGLTAPRSDSNMNR